MVYIPHRSTALHIFPTSLRPTATSPAAEQHRTSAGTTLSCLVTEACILSLKATIISTGRCYCYREKSWTWFNCAERWLTNTAAPSEQQEWRYKHTLTTRSTDGNATQTHQASSRNEGINTLTTRSTDGNATQSQEANDAHTRIKTSSVSSAINIAIINSRDKTVQILTLTSKHAWLHRETITTTDVYKISRLELHCSSANVHESQDCTLVYNLLPAICINNTARTESHLCMLHFMNN